MAWFVLRFLSVSASYVESVAAAQSPGAVHYRGVRTQLARWSPPEPKFATTMADTRSTLGPLVKEHGLSGFRSVVARVPRSRMSWLAVGPQGSDWSDDDGRTWTPVAGPGFHTFSFAPSGAVGWGAGGRGAMARLEVG